MTTTNSSGNVLNATEKAQFPKMCFGSFVLIVAHQSTSFLSVVSAGKFTETTWELKVNEACKHTSMRFMAEKEGNHERRAQAECMLALNADIGCR